jgi:hypothetical protein
MQEAVAFAEGALALALVEAGFLVGAMMNDENVNETNKQSKNKKNMPNNMKNNGAVELYRKPRVAL